MSIVASFTQVAQRVVRYAQRTSGRLAAYRQFSASAHLADPVTHPHRSTPAADSHARAEPDQDVMTPWSHPHQARSQQQYASDGTARPVPTTSRCASSRGLIVSPCSLSEPDQLREKRPETNPGALSPSTEGKRAPNRSGREHHVHRSFVHPGRATRGPLRAARLRPAAGLPPVQRQRPSRRRRPHQHRSTQATSSHAKADRCHPPQDVNTSTPSHALHILELPLHSRKGHKYHNLVRQRLASKSPPSTWLRATKPQNLPGRKAPQRHA